MPVATDEQARLETEIEAAQARVAAARALATVHESELRTALRAELDASRAAVAAMELEYEIKIASVREEARLEVARILAEASDVE